MIGIWVLFFGIVLGMFISKAKKEVINDNQWAFSTQSFWGESWTYIACPREEVLFEEGEITIKSPFVEKMYPVVSFQKNFLVENFDQRGSITARDNQQWTAQFDMQATNIVAKKDQGKWVYCDYIDNEVSLVSLYPDKRLLSWECEAINDIEKIWFICK